MKIKLSKCWPGQKVTTRRRNTDRVRPELRPCPKPDPETARQVQEDEVCPDAEPPMSRTPVEQTSPIFSLPSEILQRISRQDLSWAGEAAMSLTCRRMLNIVGTQSWNFEENIWHSYNREWEDVKDKVFMSSRQNFLSLLATDIPYGHVCFKHELVHLEDPKRFTQADIAKDNLKCNQRYRLPMGVLWGPRCADIQLAVRGVIPTENITHHQWCWVASKCKGDVERRLPCDATVYGRVVDGGFILALQFRIWIGACGHPPQKPPSYDGTPEECVLCYQECLEEITWVTSQRPPDISKLYIPSLWDFGQRKKVHLNAKPVATPILPPGNRTTVTCEHTPHVGVMVSLNMWVDLETGLRTKDILGEQERLISVPESPRYCFCKDCEGQRRMERIVQTHFEDHRQRLDALRPEMPRKPWERVHQSELKKKKEKENCGKARK